MPKGKRTLPEFSSPPVIETVLSLQFNPLKNFSPLHFGLYWGKIREEYPHYSLQPPLDPAFEKFDSQVPITRSGKLGIEFFQGPPDIRCWLINEPRTHLVQLQRDRFIINWKEGTGQEEYIRYDTFKPRFKKEWERFIQFLKSEGFSQPEINQGEVTYVNHIELNDEVKFYGEVHKVFNFWSQLPQTSFLQEPEIVRFNSQYVITGEKGRLHVDLEPKIRTRDGKEILQLKLTARGKPNSSELEDIMTWFDLGHERIVNGFAALTTTKMHKLWGRTL